MGRKYVFTGEPRYDSVEFSGKHNEAGYSQIPCFEQNLSGANCSRVAVRPDAVYLRRRQNRESLSLPIGCVYRWLHRRAPSHSFVPMADSVPVIICTTLSQPGVC